MPHIRTGRDILSRPVLKIGSGCRSAFSGLKTNLISLEILINTMKLSRLNFCPILILTVLCVCLAAGCSSVNVNSKAVEPQDQAPADPEIANVLTQIDRAPDAPAAHLKLAALYIKKARVMGDFSLNRKAEQSVDTALALEPRDPSARKLKLSLLATFHRFDEAREMAQAMLQEFPDEAFIYGILTDANVELGNYEEAVSAAQKMVDLKPNSSSYARVGHLRSLHGDHLGAVEMMKLAARTADPMDKEAQSWCLVMLGREYLKAGETDKAEKVLKESLGILPGYLLALVEKARVLAGRGDLDGALNCFSEVELSLLSPEALILRGDIAAKQGQSDKADREYELAESSARNLEGDLHRLALLWADHDVRLDEALDIAAKDYETNKDIYAADILAWCLFKKERFAEADSVMKQALRLKTKDARILYHAGMIAKSLGKEKDARNYLQAALKTNPAFDLLQVEYARAALDQ